MVRVIFRKRHWLCSKAPAGGEQGGREAEREREGERHVRRLLGEEVARGGTRG